MDLVLLTGIGNCVIMIEVLIRISTALVKWLKLAMERPVAACSVIDKYMRK